MKRTTDDTKQKEQPYFFVVMFFFIILFHWDQAIASNETDLEYQTFSCQYRYGQAISELEKIGCYFTLYKVEKTWGLLNVIMLSNADNNYSSKKLFHDTACRDYCYSKETVGENQRGCYIVMYKAVNCDAADEALICPIILTDSNNITLLQPQKKPLHINKKLLKKQYNDIYKKTIGQYAQHEWSLSLIDSPNRVFTTVLVDDSGRSPADRETLEQQLTNIFYASCNQADPEIIDEQKLTYNFDWQLSSSPFVCNNSNESLLTIDFCRIGIPRDKLTDSRLAHEKTKRWGAAPPYLQDVIEADGRQFVSQGDPPGQKSIYIMGGNYRSESYRLATFGAFPENALLPASQRDLASNGFYFTGYQDRVRCFACGSCVDQWKLNDQPLLTTWHVAGCSFCSEGDLSSGNQALDDRPFYVLMKSLKIVDKVPETAAGASHQRAMGAAINLPASRRFGFGNIFDNNHKASLYEREKELPQEEVRYTTFGKWPPYLDPLLPVELAKDGFFYLGNLDRVQCIHCELVLRNWAPNDTVRTEHQKHSSACPFIERPNLSSNRALSDEQRARNKRALQQKMNKNTSQEFISERRQLEKILFTLVQEPSHVNLQPAAPYMAGYTERVNSFNNHAYSVRQVFTKLNLKNSSSNTNNSGIEAVAEAGFYYVPPTAENSPKDKARCYHCNGGLQNWDQDDDPWIEHAKYFPGCLLPICHLGPRTVKQIANNFPELSRPKIRDPLSLDSLIEKLGGLNEGENSASRARENQSSQGAQALASHQYRPNNTAIMPHSGVFQSPEVSPEISLRNTLNNMGFNAEHINQAIAQWKRENPELVISDTNDVASSLVGMLTNISSPEPMDTSPAPLSSMISTSQNTVTGLDDPLLPPSMSGASSNVPPETNDNSLGGQLRNAEKQSNCVVCGKNPRNILVLPCGHLIYCDQCNSEDFLLNRELCTKSHKARII